VYHAAVRAHATRAALNEQENRVMRFALTSSVGFIAVGVALSVACGGSKPEPAVATPAASGSSVTDNTVRPITQGQLKVGHYASADGVVGLVLDRTGARPKVRVDGEKDIIELTMEEDRHGGERRGWYLKAPDGKNVLYLGAHGDVRIYRGRDEIVVTSDKAADPLPAATIAGEYKRPKSDYDVTVEALTPLTVHAHSAASWKPEDSGNLAKVGDALAAATPDMVVHVTELGSKAARWAPASRHIGNVHQGLGGSVGHAPSDDAWDKTKPGLAKFGGVLVPMRSEYGSPNRLHLNTLKGWPPPLAAGTPGILWDVDDGTVVFLTFDGGRYEMSVSEGKVVEPGPTPQASWPPPLQHALLDVDSIRGFAKGSAMPEKIGKDIEAADDAWWSCMNDQWKKAKAESDKIEASPSSANDKWGRLGGVRKSAELAAPKTCEPKRKELDAALTKLIEGRNVERLSLLERSKAKWK
jgi:hypothetical protein